MTNAVTKEEAQTAVATRPSFLAAQAVKGTGAGNENVTQKDLQIPRLTILQDLSPEINPKKPEYIAGAKQGMILNKMTGELHEQMFVINLKYVFGYTVWKLRKLGGGIFGTFATEEEAVNALQEKNLDVTHYEITETPAHFLLLLDAEGNPVMPAIVDMPSTKARVSRNWNSLIASQGDEYDRFAFVWLMGTKYEENSQSQGYYNFDIEFLGAAPEHLVEQARKIYASIN